MSPPGDDGDDPSPRDGSDEATPGGGSPDPNGPPDQTGPRDPTEPRDPTAPQDSTTPQDANGPRDSPSNDPAEPKTSNGGRPAAPDEPLGDRREEDDVDWTTFVYDLVSSVAAVLLVGALLFAVSGVWPPMVAIESPSMDPHMKAGDLVFVMDEQRFPGEGAQAGTGVVSAHAGADTDYRKFQQPGDVIVFHPNGNEDRTPIIHRAMFWVEEGENWYDEANESYVHADDCEDMSNCDAPHAGFITKGDANPTYDQVGDSLSEPVKPEWIVGTAQVRVPWLGCIRLKTSGQNNVCQLQTAAPVAGSAVSGGASSVDAAAQSGAITEPTNTTVAPENQTTGVTSAANASAS